MTAAMVDRTPDNALIGTWLLRSHRVEDGTTGEQTEPFGATPAGVLIIGADGRMTALITTGTTSSPSADAPPAVAAPIVAYSGRYRLLPPDRFVTTVDVAWFGSWVGTEQERIYTVTGDQLDLRTVLAPPSPGGGLEASKIGIMRWVRETTAVASDRTSD